MEKTMNWRKRSFRVTAMLAFWLGIFSLTVVAQQEEALEAGKKGEIHTSKPIRVGDTLLQPGMYQVQHVMEGSDHIIVFREVTMGYRGNMGNTKTGKEVARVKCKVAPLDEKVGSTKVFLRTNAAGEKEVEGVQVRGEKVRHLI